MTDFKDHKISSPIGLMLDNLVYNRHGEVHAIRINDLHAFDHPDMGGNYGLYSIPLTAEWLNKMDCRWTGGVWWDFEMEGFSFSLDHFGFIDNEGCRYHDYPMLYLHQAQNWFYCKTGKNLTIKQ